MDYLLASFAVIGFLCVVGVMEGAYLLWESSRGTEARRLQQRLQTLSAGGGSRSESEVLKRKLADESPLVGRLMLLLPRLRSMDRLVLQSGLSTTVSKLLLHSLLAGTAGLIAGLVLRLPWFAVLGGMAAAAALPGVRMLRARRVRLQAIERQLPDVLELMARALRAGHAFSSALQTAGEEAPEPIAAELKATFDEVNFGVAMGEALTNLAVRVPVTDLRFFVIAVGIQRETGGNLAELLDQLATLIRARFKLLGTVRVLSSEGRLSALILTVLPFALVGVINVVNPAFMSILWKDPAGLMAVQLGLGFMAIGIVWMWRIVKLRV